MGTADDIPGNTNTSEIDLNNGGWIIIAILIAIILFLIVLSIFISIKNDKKHEKQIQEITKNNITAEEVNLLLQYRELTQRDKAIIKDNITTLNEHHSQEYLPTKGEK